MVFKDYSHLTPAMQQFMVMKERYPDCLILFRMGDFYETFYEDAVKASKALDITLTSRGKGEKKAPLAGIPYHALEPYLAKLVKQGIKVAICEQIEDPKKAKGLVKRDVVRVVTAGTLMESSMLDEKNNNYVISLYPYSEKFAIAVCDMSTGEFQTIECQNFDEVKNQISKLTPSECIIPYTLNVNKEIIDELKKHNFTINNYDDRHFQKENAYKTLTQHFQVSNLVGFGIEEKPLSVSASGALLSYLLDTQKTNLTHINKVSTINTQQYMALDSSTLRNLELTTNILDNSTRGTLLSVLDKTQSSMGARLIKKIIKEPLLDLEKINRRLDAVECIAKNLIAKEELVTILKQLSDLQRLISRVNYGNANGRDLIALKNTLLLVPFIKLELEKFDSVLLKKISEFPDVSQVSNLIRKAIREDPPVSLREGNIIQSEFNEELKQLHHVRKNGKLIIKEIEERERLKTGIKNLKVGYNRVFGYFLEVTKSNSHLVPDHYIRKQTRVNSERYVTEELKEQESLILGAQEKIQSLEYDLFQNIIQEISKFTAHIQKISNNLAYTDVLCSFATVATENNYVKPKVTDGTLICMKDSRHPVVEQIEKLYVPNDITIDNSEIMIITGPNMSGKSSVMRQVTLNVLMAQIGSFVSCSEAEISMVDKIFTRIGAYDDLTMGQSTFMVEMNETANILNNATAKSLIILDEIGRGTSTFDGVSIAWSVVEYIYNHLKAKTLFATHYHVLNKLAEDFENIRNYNILVKEENDEIIFLRKLIEGGTDQSFGVHVAKLAGLPQKVIERAQEIQKDLEEKDKMTEKIQAKQFEHQKSLYEVKNE